MFNAKVNNEPTQAIFNARAKCSARARAHTQNYLSQKLNQDVSKNIILITLDAFTFNIFIHNLDNLPNLKKIKENGVFFKYAFSTGAMTKFSFPSIIGSIYPYSYGLKIPERVMTLDSILKKNGYNTALINESQAFLTPYFGYCINIDYVKHFLNFSHAKIDRTNKEFFFEKNTTDISKKNMNKPFLNFIYSRLREDIKNTLIKKIFNIFRHTIQFFNLYIFKNYENYKDRKKLHSIFINELINFINNKFNQPQFLWIHTMVNHLPYLPSDTLKFSERRINYLNFRGLSRLVNTKCSKNLKHLFIESLKTTDNLIGYIIKNLEKKESLLNSIIIITADHGEEFFENGYYGHDIQSSSDMLLRIPLLFYSPKLFKPKIITAPVSTLDILPTIIDLLSLQKPDTVQGYSLKNFLLKNLPDKIEEDKFWWRPLFSESWVTNGVFDLNPGYKSKEKIFTIRLNKFKLIIKQIKNNNNIKNQYILKNWVNKKRLEIKNNYLLFKELINLLSEHLSHQIML